MTHDAIEILLVEDDPSDSYLIEEVLKQGRTNLKVKLVGDGEAALASIRSKRPDAVILDLHLPKMDGLEVLRKIRKDPAFKSIPVVILTTSKADQDVLESYGLGANWYITKPAGLRDLEKVVATLEEFLVSVVKLPEGAVIPPEAQEEQEGMKPPIVQEKFLRGIPKAELHLHIEGTLEPELMFAIAKRNKIPLRFRNVAELKKAYAFNNLQSFLDIYYEGAKVLIHEQDFFDLAWAYFERVAGQGLRHVELFFDPQTHTDRGIAMKTVIEGLSHAQIEAQGRLGISSRLIMCFLRHLSADAAMKTLDEALPYKRLITGVGLDSSEVGHPPKKFKKVFDKARAEGLKTVAHAGEEGPPEYIWEALDELGVSRVDHGVRCIEDKELVRRLVRDNIPLTVCPLSNVKLKVFRDLKKHTLRKMMNLGLKVTVNSDDPAYFGGYVLENLTETQRALGLSAKDIFYLEKNAFEASFLEKSEKERLLKQLDSFCKISASAVTTLR